MTSAFNPRDDQRQIVYASSTNSGGGILSFQNHGIAVTQVFSGNDAEIEFSLTGTVDNFAPYVSAPGTFTVSCGRNVTIDALVEDVDDPSSALDVRWFVDGDLVHQGLGPLTTNLSTGTHTITILARDSHGAFGSDYTTVTVEADTTPPQIVASAPVCVWPPNHDYSVLTAGDLSVLAVDDCDPSPSVRFVGGASSHPDNGFGDGNTTRVSVRWTAPASPF